MQTLGIIGLGAFGQLLAETMQPHFRIIASDPSKYAASFAKQAGIDLVALPESAKADILVLAVPVQAISDVAREVAPHLGPDTLVMDVASVKIGPCEAMQSAFPATTPILGTHPLFGPQSAKTGLQGLKLALCPVQNVDGERVQCVAGFLENRIGLQSYVTTPQQHDRDMAMVQGLTHLVAKVLHQMKPLPDDLTTLSFDHLVTAMNLVSGDSDALFRAIEQENPYSAQVRADFFARIDDLREHLEH